MLSIRRLRQASPSPLSHASSCSDSSRSILGMPSSSYVVLLEPVQKTHYYSNRMALWKPIVTLLALLLVLHLAPPSAPLPRYRRAVRRRRRHKLMNALMELPSSFSQSLPNVLVVDTSRDHTATDTFFRLVQQSQDSATWDSSVVLCTPPADASPPNGQTQEAARALYKAGNRFAHCPSTTRYRMDSYHSIGQPEIIKQVFDDLVEEEENVEDVRIIILWQDPVVHAVQSFRAQQQSANKALPDLKQLTQQLTQQVDLIAEQEHAVELLSRWLDVFAPSQILLLPVDDLQSDSHVEQLVNFLGLSGASRSTMKKKIQRSSQSQQCREWHEKLAKVVEPYHEPIRQLLSHHPARTPMEDDFLQMPLDEC